MAKDHVFSPSLIK